MSLRSNQEITRRQLHVDFGLALLVAGGVFFLHATVLFGVASQMFSAKAWLTESYGPAITGLALVLVSFFFLFITHLIEAATWGLFLWRKGLLTTFTEGVYFAAASITALGYGDVLLPTPWRIIGPVVAISGILMFGCSTAFLFLVMHKAWVLEL
ncbi:MAG: ion channel [Chromatiales bacterium]